MERPAKRVRQACIPCRRKKTRCPGEKPICSYCSRLNQDCSYAADDSTLPSHEGSNGHAHIEGLLQSPVDEVNTDQMECQPLRGRQTTDRLDKIENQLGMVVDILTHQSRLDPQRQYSTTESTYTVSELLADLGWLPRQAQDEQLDIVWNEFRQYGYCQPLPLFAESSSTIDLASRDGELILALVTLSSHYGRSIEQCGRVVDALNAMIMERIASGVVELSTIQSLCLLTLFDFYNCNAHRASLYLSLAISLGQSARLSQACRSAPNDLMQEEKVRCFWSIILLARLHGHPLDLMSLQIMDEYGLQYPQSSAPPPRAQTDNRDQRTNAMASSGHRDLGIVAYVIQLSKTWQRTVQYARRRRQPDDQPPWSTGSEYAKILAEQMERETEMPYHRHRFKPSNFAEQSSIDLSKHRSYWGPWLLNQMMYHATICLLNHPLLLSLRLRRFRLASVPEIWLQHTDDLVSSHTQWMIHLIELVVTKEFIVSDPTLAHFAAIVATIFLQQSYAEDIEVRETKKEGWLTCLHFCERIGERWPQIKKLTEKLRKFEDGVSASYQDSANSISTGKVYIDLTVFWEILESSSLMSEARDRDGLKLGSSLVHQYEQSTNAVELDAHPLPEPNRLTTLKSSRDSRLARHASSHNLQIDDGTQLPADAFNLMNDDFTVLAQSYFAQGQDFVGGLDDWWALSQT